MNSVMAVREVANYFKVSIMTVHRWISKEDLPSFKIGGRRLVSTTDLLKWIDYKKGEQAKLARHLCTGRPAKYTK